MNFPKLTAFVCFGLLLLAQAASSQCTTLGQNPSTAFPVCGNTTFEQTQVPICGNQDLYVPGCTDGAQYATRNPFWYKFTCFQSGTLSFRVTPQNMGDDYDWQLYDITGLNPDEVYTNRSIIVAGNWAGTYGITGASGTGVAGIQCASDPADNEPSFARSPNLIAGHEYLLLISHYTDSQSGYSLNFSGGTAVITDPLEPHLFEASTNCDGRQIRVTLNKKMKCSSLSPDGSDFRIFPASAAIVSAVATNCNTGFDFNELIVTLATPLPAGNYQLIMDNGGDNNSVLDICDRAVPINEQIPFDYQTPQPIVFDSIGKVGCAPGVLKVYFPKKIRCSSLAADGSDFTITGPNAVAVTNVTGNCGADDLTDVVNVQLGAPIFTNGTYTLHLVMGNDGNTVIDECGQLSTPHSEAFVTYDTVSARFTYTSLLGCKSDTLRFVHDGAHGVSNWIWTVNSTIQSNTPTHTQIFSSSSTNVVLLEVKNEVCTDRYSETIVLDNEVKAAFDAPAVICPEDLYAVVNNSKGNVDIWDWRFGNISTSNQRDPAPIQFPGTNIETVYSVKLRAINNTLGCTDSITKQLKVLNNCYIAVPTAFTPNNDGRNDYLYPNNALKADKLDFKVYNRWGQLVFQSKEWTRKWDGKVNGVDQGSGVFVWFLSYTNPDTKQKVFQKGTTTLIR